MSRKALADQAGLPVRRVTYLVTLLEQVGAVRAGKGGRLSVPSYAPSPAEAADLAAGQIEWYQVLRRSRIDMMLQYAERGSCRVPRSLVHRV